MSSTKWPTLFNNGPLISGGDDALVPFNSQVNGTSPYTVYNGLVHSIGTYDIGFNGPSVLDDPQAAVPNQVILLLNTNKKDATAFSNFNP
jgi:hypothetical protein